ncbi:MAG: HAMP domain-containing histidine kinase [Clostridia bacterium]|nr:HAMP domain-containing histidine kinase [Clostridia bacterium]
MQQENTKPARRHLGIRWRLFGCLAAFALLILVLVWVFQIQLLRFFYEKEKLSAMQEHVDDLVQYLEGENIAERVENCAQENAMCIRIIREKDGHFEQIADTNVSPVCVLHNLSSESIGNLYRKTMENGGSYNERTEFTPNGLKPESTAPLPLFKHDAISIHSIYCQTVSTESAEYLIMADCELLPLSTVTDTLRTQFFWIGVALLMATIFFAFLMSRMITKPLADITERAKGLASGNYENGDFPNAYQEVQQLSEVLDFAANEIQATDRLQKELIANISHDLRTPLTMIKGYGEMMRDLPGENTPENLQAIIDETTRLSELVRDLTDLSKLQSGVQKPTPTVFDLTATVRDTLQRYDRLVKHEGYEIVFEGTEEALVLADRTMLLQVIYNLINNAVNYTGESRRVVVRKEIVGDKVRLSVADDGEGIAPEQIAEIWDRYYRVDKVHKRAVMGTGLGLSIVKTILEAHHAVYGVDSAIGVGSIFWFELPLATEQNEEK